MFQFESEGRKTGVQVKQSGRKISLLHSGVSAFSVLFRHSTDWMRPTHSREGNLLYSFLPIEMLILSKDPHRHTQNICPNIWTLVAQLNWHIKLTSKPPPCLLRLTYKASRNILPAWLLNCQLTGTLVLWKLVAQLLKNLPAMWMTWVQFLGWWDSLEKGMATHSSILAWRIP